ncbi:MAG: hypothetical protein AAFV80_18510 [Bacteroidota bacterium]
MRSFAFLFFFGCSILSCFSQNRSVIHVPAISEDILIVSGPAGDLIDEVIADDNVIYLLQESTEGDRAYFRINDSTFLCRAYLGMEIGETGRYFMDRSITLRTDSLIVFDPETYLESFAVFQVHPIVKIGWWNEQETADIWCNGTYHKGKKQAYWGCGNNQQIQYGQEYQQGELVALVDPGQIQIEPYLDWLLNKKHFLTKVGQGFTNGATNQTSWHLTENTDTTHGDLGVFTFSTAGNFEFSAQSNAPASISRKGKNGKWTISPKGNLNLQFSDGTAMTFSIDYYGKALIVLTILEEN